MKVPPLIVFAVLAWAFFTISSSFAEPLNAALANQVKGYMQAGDNASVRKLIDAQEDGWKAKPTVGYFRDMFVIGEALTGGTTSETFWLGRSTIWKLVLKPAPNEEGAVKQVRLFKEDALFLGAEEVAIPYVNNLPPETFAALRHDTFSMLSEYARLTSARSFPDTATSLQVR